MFPDFSQLNAKWTWMLAPPMDEDVVWLRGFLCYFNSTNRIPVSKRLCFDIEGDNCLQFLQKVQMIFHKLDKGLYLCINSLPNTATSLRCCLRIKSVPLRTYFDTYFNCKANVMNYLDTQEQINMFEKGLADAAQI